MCVFIFPSACPAGEYRSVNDTTCQQCPGNTVMDQEAAAQCECLDGYFRNDENRVTDSRAQALLSPANEQLSTACTREFNVQMYNIYHSLYYHCLFC